MLPGGACQPSIRPWLTARPRHLAEPSKRFGLSPLQQLFLVAMLSLAAITAVIALLTRDAGTGGRPAAGAGHHPGPGRRHHRPAATTGPEHGHGDHAPATTRPIRPTPGNLLADGDFERDLAGWTPLGGAGVERVEGGASGRWAAAVTPGAGSGTARRA